MTSAAQQPRMTFAEYLAAERAGNIKHEFLDGRVWPLWREDAAHAMSGGTRTHAQLAMNVGAELRAQLRGKGCQVYNSDLIVRVAATGIATYPDVSIVCGGGETDPEDEHVLTNPTVIVEVLSESTEHYDRGEKFAHHRRIPSLRAYVLISQKEPRIEVFARNDAADGGWTLHEARQGEIAIVAIHCRLDVARVYEDVRLATT